jgi:hypothetical protein
MNSTRLTGNIRERSDCLQVFIVHEFLQSENELTCKIKLMFFETLLHVLELFTVKQLNCVVTVLLLKYVIRLQKQATILPTDRETDDWAE